MVKILGLCLVFCMHFLGCVQEEQKAGDALPEVSEFTQPTKLPPKPNNKSERLRVCGDILSRFKNPDNFLLSTLSFNKRFELKNDLRSASKSGAFPAIVLSKKDNTYKFLKIFPKIIEALPDKDIVRDPSYLEIFQSCRLAQLHLTANLPHNMEARRFFVDIYEIGFLKTDDPFIQPDGDNEYYPYMLSEAVDGVTLTKLVTEPNEVAKPENLGFNFDTAQPMVLESILMQIIVALKNSYLAWKLVHHDLHTGNIMISKHEKADFIVDFEGKKMQLVGPLIKIIDFGLGESEDLSQKKSLNYNVWIKNRPVIKELEEFITVAKKGRDIPISTRLRIARISSNQDISMFNLILRALKDILNSRGSMVENGRYCKDYDDCIRLMSTWWK